jgi:hypothetical protein
VVVVVVAVAQEAVMVAAEAGATGAVIFNPHSVGEVVALTQVVVEVVLIGAPEVLEDLEALVL